MPLSQCSGPWNGSLELVWKRSGLFCNIDGASRAL
jgi:hypothetical protein